MHLQKKTITMNNYILGESNVKPRDIKGELKGRDLVREHCKDIQFAYNTSGSHLKRSNRHTTITPVVPNTQVRFVYTLLPQMLLKELKQ